MSNRTICAALIFMVSITLFLQSTDDLPSSIESPTQLIKPPSPFNKNSDQYTFSIASKNSLKEPSVNQFWKSSKTHAEQPQYQPQGIEAE